MTKKEFEALLEEYRYALYDYASAQGEADGQAQAEGVYHYFSADDSEANRLEKKLIDAFDKIYNDGWNEAVKQERG